MPVDLSVVIVNYNVRFFLEQCLHSVEKAIRHLNAEIIVVDNNSVDGSNQMVRQKFPQVKLIANKKNVGFSKANNQGFEIASGEHILILNPDTIVQEDTFIKCREFMESHPDAGALGVKMIDGKGDFLPESKRSLPTPAVSFYKVFGLSALFPKSRVFGQYHLGFLDKEKTHSIEILPGAFMWVRKKVLDEIGYFDETYFMYGEDIDLSYRIIKAGFKNYYYPGTTIIHYKGESTKKGSINYVMVFYRAMIIFARKHFSRKNAWLFSLLINLAIYLRASVSILRRVFLATIIPFTDALLIYLGFYIMEPLWETMKFGIEGYYPREYMFLVVPGYILIWFMSLYISGGYEKRMRLLDVIRGMAMGSLVILLIYALLPEHLRYSRALILFGSAWALLASVFTRLSLGRLLNLSQIQFSSVRKRIAIVGTKAESERITGILKSVDISPIVVGLVSSASEAPEQGYLGNLQQLEEIIEINKVDEIVFCAKDIPSQDIIATMLKASSSQVEFKIAPPESLSIIGSNSINTAGELYVLHFNSLSTASARRKKRMVDVLLSLVLLVFSPVFIFFMRQPGGFLKNILIVLVGAKTWVGLLDFPGWDQDMVPQLKSGILSPVPVNRSDSASEETIRRLNLLYAKDYKIMNDISIVYRDFRNLGKN